MVLPLVVYGMKALTRLQVWTTPLWLVLMVVPVVWLIVKDPQLVDGFLHFAGKNSASTVDITAIMLGAGVCLSLIMQIGEQIDYLRFMPPKTAENRKSWWLAVFSAGPGWVVLGAIKQIIGAFLGFYLLTRFPAVHNTEPVQQFVSVFDNTVPGWLALTLAVVLVVISQIKINVTNAYSGSLAWTSARPAPPNAIRDGLFLWWSTRRLPRTDGGRYVQRPVVDPRLLLQLRHRLGRGGGDRHHL